MDRNTLVDILPKRDLLSLSARRAWIEIIDDLEPSSTRKLSLSARRAWIEIPTLEGHKKLKCVALRKESVDRNYLSPLQSTMQVTVALRKESVDRNSRWSPT